MIKRIWLLIFALIIVSCGLSQYRSTSKVRYLGKVESKKHTPAMRYLQRVHDAKSDDHIYEEKELPERFEITVSYDRLVNEENTISINPKEITLDNKEYYDSFREGYYVWVYVTTVYDAFGRTVEESYTLTKCGT